MPEAHLCVREKIEPLIFRKILTKPKKLLLWFGRELRAFEGGLKEAEVGELLSFLKSENLRKEQRAVA